MENKKITKNTSKAKEYFLEEISFTKSPEELKNCIANNINKLNIIDVRTYDDYIDGHIPFAIHVPLETIEDHFAMLDKEAINIVYGYCPYCTLAQKAAFNMTEKGYPTMVLKGGYHIWVKKGFDTVKTGANS